MSKFKIGETYADEENNQIRIEDTALLKHGEFSFLALVGYNLTETHAPRYYTPKGAGIQGLTRSGFSSPADLVPVQIVSE